MRWTPERIHTHHDKLNRCKLGRFETNLDRKDVMSHVVHSTLPLLHVPILSSICLQTSFNHNDVGRVESLHGLLLSFFKFDFFCKSLGTTSKQNSVEQQNQAEYLKSTPSDRQHFSDVSIFPNPNRKHNPKGAVFHPFPCHMDASVPPTRTHPLDAPLTVEGTESS